MKRLFIIALLVFATSTGAFSQTVDMPYVRNARPFIPTVTLFSAVTATGAGAAISIGVPFTKFTCVNTWGGTVPTNEIVDLEGSLDNSVWVQLVRTTVTASPTIYSTSGGHAVFYIRGNYISKSGGSGTTSVTMNCTAIYQ